MSLCRLHLRTLFAFGLVLWLPLSARGAIEETKHNLSVSGRGRIRAVSQSRVCAFCHVPHAGEKAPLALWSRPVQEQPYIPYESTTLSAPVPQPDGASKLCLSCHDGTIALGAIRRHGPVVPMYGTAAGGVLPVGPSNLGTDLRGSHPVSMKIPASNLEVHPPGDKHVRLDAAGKVQCTSCHDPHRDRRDPLVQKFLVKDNTYSTICLACHTIIEWGSGMSAHQSSEAQFPRAAGNTTPYATVAQTGCLACHKQHNGEPNPRLLAAGEEMTCIGCHSTSVTRVDILADFQKPYVHPVFNALPSKHDAAERPGHQRFPLPELSPATPRHVECVDCHNPHAANARAAVPPMISGALEAVWGIDRFGREVDPAQYEYEVCFKCHADSRNRPQVAGTARDQIRRQVDSTNLRLAFDPMGASSHPVVGSARGNIPGLRIDPSARSGSQIYCSDCHGSDSGSAAPHGSIYPFLLSDRYETRGPVMESPKSYALCYRCHDRDVLLSSQSNFPEHRRHVSQVGASCATCHTPHGTGGAGGQSARHAHLVNFDIETVLPSKKSRQLYYESRGSAGAGACSLNCHGAEHANVEYAPLPSMPTLPVSGFSR